MRKNSLEKNGLSLSQAQSISNLCNQRARDIEMKLSDVNNASKTIEIGSKTYTDTPAKPLPANVVELLMEKSKLHATQAFLMENIQAKDQLLKSVTAETLDFEKETPMPETPELEYFQPEKQVGESWGWEQLTVSEYNEYLEAESYASHIGQFIHKGGTLDTLRKELPKIKTLEFIEIEKDKKTPMVIATHHTSEKLLELHEALAAEHRKFEQRVNYFKSKVKNLVTKENARISKENAEKQNEINLKNQALVETHKIEMNKWREEKKVATHTFESLKQDRIKEIVDLRIKIDPRFQDVIDIFTKDATIE